MADLSFDSSLVVRIDEEGLSCEDVERRLAAVLEGQGYVKDTYAQAIVDREANFPTAEIARRLSIYRTVDLDIKILL